MLDKNSYFDRFDIQDKTAREDQAKSAVLCENAIDGFRIEFIKNGSVLINEFELTANAVVERASDDYNDNQDELDFEELICKSIVFENNPILRESLSRALHDCICDLME